MPEDDAITICTGSVEDIDTLCAIDLETAELFERAGLRIDIPDDHEFSLHERTRWLQSLAARRTLLARDEAGAIVGFAASGELDGEPYLEQLSVRMSAMRRGIGTQLLSAAIDLAKCEQAHALWLTTYAHLPWNRLFYEQHGFVLVPTGEYRAGIAGEIEFQRRWLPRPEQRVVMRRPLDV